MDSILKFFPIYGKPIKHHPSTISQHILYSEHWIPYISIEDNNKTPRSRASYLTPCTGCSLSIAHYEDVQLKCVIESLMQHCLKISKVKKLTSSERKKY